MALEIIHFDLMGKDGRFKRRLGISGKGLAFLEMVTLADFTTRIP